MTNPPRMPRADGLIAPVWHTALLLVWIVGVSLTGLALAFLRPAAISAPSSVWAVYAQIVVAQLMMLGYVTRLGIGRSIFGALLGERWASPRRALGDVTLAFVMAVVILSTEALWARIFGARQPAAVSTMVPHTWTERTAWVGIAVLIGLTEEVVYRGYLQKQLGILLGRPAWGVLLSALVFGLAHADQGVALAMRIAGYGLLFGVASQLRRSLIPAILAHALIDAGGSLARAS